MIKIPFNDESNSLFCRKSTRGVKSTDVDPPRGDGRNGGSSEGCSCRKFIGLLIRNTNHRPMLPTRTLKSRLISRFALDRDFPPGKASKRRETRRDISGFPS